jgi:hypothetical protein
MDFQGSASEARDLLDLGNTCTLRRRFGELIYLLDDGCIHREVVLYIKTLYCIEGCF